MRWVNKNNHAKVARKRRSLRALMLAFVTHPATAAWLQGFAAVAALGLTYHLARETAQDNEKCENFAVLALANELTRSVAGAVDACKSRIAWEGRRAAGELAQVGELAKSMKLSRLSPRSMFVVGMIDLGAQDGIDALDNLATGCQEDRLQMAVNRAQNSFDVASR
jgi:hypothetical protein